MQHVCDLLVEYIHNTRYYPECPQVNSHRVKIYLL